MDYTLGIDMGVASVGWAAISTEDQYIDCGVRVYPAGVDNFNSSKEKHPNQDRREARSMRRRIRRKAQRKKVLRESLQEAGMMPKTEGEIANWLDMDVYALRHRALEEPVSLHELGRILFHLNQRRGFLSLRKKEESEPGNVETKGMLGEISALQEQIDASGHQTLGNYLYHLYQTDREHIRLRNRHTRRSMIYNEFCLIWDRQRAYHPDTLTDHTRYGLLGPRPKPTAVSKPLRRTSNTMLEQFGIENIIFFQRAVFWKPSSIGHCELEPNEYRAPLADRRFQRFRMLQEINNLRVLDPTQEMVTERPLTSEERACIIEYASTKKEVKFPELKKHLARKLSDERVLRYQFNLEEGGRAKLSAMPTDHALASKKAYGKEWWRLGEDIRNAINGVLYNQEATDDDIATALEELDLPADKIEALLHVHLPAGYGRLSITAIEKLLPHIEQGLLYHTQDQTASALHAAGYTRRDEAVNRVYDLLPPYEHNDIPHLPVINSPTVKRSLTELRKVINGIIRKHGKPVRIHIEMARDLKMGPEKRKEINRENKEREERRGEARSVLEKHDIIPNRTAENLYLLWQEQNQRCAYSCRPIGIHQLLGGEVEIDHIFPFSRSADDSLMNKVVCFRAENRGKGNQTPYEWLADSDPDKYEHMIQQAKDWPYPKKQRLIAQEIPQGFVNRDLNDTAWMAKAARQYLACLFGQSHLVQGTKGAHTGKLREHWQLLSILRNDGIELKNRDDHRHHALDAAIIALCDQHVIYALADQQHFELNMEPAGDGRYRIYHQHSKQNPLDPPWDNFRSDLEEALNRIWVSHRPRKKVSGPFHKETYYGKTPDGYLVVRKPVSELTDKMLRHIRDKGIQTIIADHLRGGGTLKDEIIMSSGRPIKKVRILVNNANTAIRGGTAHVQSAATHHVAIFLLPDGAHHFEPVTLIEAARRLRNKEALVQHYFKDMPEGTTFRMHLCPGDSMLAEEDGSEQLFIFNTMAVTSKQVWFAHHLDATAKHKDPDTGKSLLVSCMPSTFDAKFPHARKVSILPSGEVRNAG